MPSNYTDQQKSAAMEMLAIGDNIAFIHYSTGIPERTLRRWRQKRHEQSNAIRWPKKVFPRLLTRGQRRKHTPATDSINLIPTKLTSRLAPTTKISPTSANSSCSTP